MDVLRFSRKSLKGGVLTSNTYTEDEFKQVLKNLFAEKKRVKELQKQLEEKGLQKKFQTKIADIQKFSLAEEYAKLKANYLDKEREGEHFKRQFEKVRPALKKLVDDLNSARAEIETLKEQTPPKQEDLKAVLEEASLKIKELTLEKERLSKEWEEEREDFRKKNEFFEEEQKKFDQKMESFNKILEEERGEIARAKADEQKETQRFESEKGRLVERLAESLSQVQRQTEMIKELREELNSVQKKNEEREEQEKYAQQELHQLKSELAKAAFESAQANNIAEYGLSALKEEKEVLQIKISHLEAEVEHERNARVKLEQLEHGDLQNEYVAQLNEALCARDLIKEELVAIQENFTLLMTQKEAAQEEILERTYSKMREFSTRHAEGVQEKEFLLKKIEENEKQLARFEKEHTTLQTVLKNAKLQCEERDAEIRKAQQHLAKKVKETTILRDLVERQKIQLLEVHATCEKQKNEIEKAHTSLSLQRMHEEKLQTMAKERTQAAEGLTKEWQEKYLSLQQDWQEKKAQLLEFQKMRKTYDQMATTFSSLKNILGHPIEPASPEEPDHHRH